MKAVVLKNIYGCQASCIHRSFSTSPVSNNVKNFARFSLIYRGTEREKKQQKENPDRSVLGWSYGVRHPGYFVGNRFVLIPENIPEIVVPDLTDCQDIGLNPFPKRHLPENQKPEVYLPKSYALRKIYFNKFQPYVSYRSPENSRSEFTARELFDYIYCDKIEEDFKNKKLDAEGNPLEPSEEEKLTAQEAFDRGRRTGSDLFTQDRPYPTRRERLGLD